MGLLELAIAAFVISLIAGALGWTGLARGAAKFAKIIFVIFLIIAAILVLLLIAGIGAIT
jgi:uncharacterized membrane protein YtjA (UPF0391 family)